MDNKKNKGFTLIEIIVVLIILSILASIIILKYFALETEAREKAAKGVVAELQARANLHFTKAKLAYPEPIPFDTDLCADADIDSCYVFDESAQILISPDGYRFSVKFTPPVIVPLPNQDPSPALFEYVGPLE